jgi:hypothetical protein
MKKLEKLKIQIRNVPYIYLSFDMLCGEINEVSKNILDIKNKLKEACVLRDKQFAKTIALSTFTPFKDYKYIMFNVVSDYDGEKEIVIEVFRDETDEEYEDRLKEEEISFNLKKLASKRRKEQKEIKEKAFLEKLKLKYEKNN